MKTLYFALLLSILIVGTDVYAATSRVGTAQDIGIGTMLGQPMGVTAKYWTSSSVAVDAAMGYHFNHNFDMHADMLWHTFSSFDISNGRLPFYVGLGARTLLGDDNQLGARLPFGASYLPSSDPIELFVELAPVVELVPDIGLDIDGIVGIRVYLNYLK